jgi:hypothetical protein
MRMKMFASILLFLVFVAIAPNAHATIKDGPFNNDPPCPDLDRSVTQADNGGIAGGMSACTAYKYCVDCGEQPDGKSVCVKSYQNGYCKCGYITQAGKRYCSANGACTYKGV